MPEEQRYYHGIIFTTNVIKSAIKAIKENLKFSKLKFDNNQILFPNLRGTYDNDAEFFNDYRKGDFLGVLFHKIVDDNRSIYLHTDERNTDITIKMPNWDEVVKVFEIFEENACKCTLPEPPLKKPVIFIGHGHNTQWKDLKDHLYEMHGLYVECYEIDPRAGFTPKEVLNKMLAISSYAILVFTGEDQDAEGGLHARENVIHELGLFQGRLGWEKAIVLLEDGVKEFSNIIGVTQIRFNKGHIRETFGDVIATIKREFPHGW